MAGGRTEHEQDRSASEVMQNAIDADDFEVQLKVANVQSSDQPVDER